MKYIQRVAALAGLCCVVYAAYNTFSVANERAACEARGGHLILVKFNTYGCYRLEPM